MNNMVPFQNAQVPAFLQQTGLTPEQVKAMNAAAATGTGGGGVNKISLKQSRFRMVVGGQESVIPSMELDLVIVRVNEGISKTWYEKEWNPNEEAGAPECSSDDGISPRADSPKKQCGPDGLCANCPQNQWGSKINRITGEKVKACTDTKRMAIMAPGADGRYYNKGSDLYQLSVPPASLKDFGGFVRGLAAMPTPAGYNMVVARIGFDPSVSYPKILFKPLRWLEPDEWEAVRSMYDGDETQRVAGIASAQTMRPVGQLGAPTQVQPQVQAQAQQQAPVQQPQQAQWGQPQQVQQQAPVQQPQQAQWGQPQQAPVQQDQQAQWGQPQQVQQAPVQQQEQAQWGQPQQVQQPQQQAPVQQEQQAQAAPTQRERGKPSPGRSRRTKVEIAEDDAADARDAAAAQGAQTQQAPVQQAQQPQQQAQWGQPQQAPAQQDQQAQWGQPQPVQQQAPVQQAQPQVDPANPWGSAPGAQPQVGAPVQPGVMAGADAVGAFQGWDD